MSPFECMTPGWSEPGSNRPNVEFENITSGYAVNQDLFGRLVIR